MEQEQPLELKFDANTIDDLGAKLYSTLPPILAELIANGYDAGASEIYLEFFDNLDEGKKIVISDNGAGMSYSEINDNYLLVGRKKREEKETVDPIFNRPVMGKKGLGKLSFFGITDRAEIYTTKDGQCIKFVMDREEIRKGTEYFPSFEITDSDQASGTRVELHNIKRDSGFVLQSLKNRISNYFIFDGNFKVFIRHNDGEYEEINNETRFGQLDIQFDWEFPNANYPDDNNIKGKVFATIKPLPKKLRGISLISRQKLVNRPELFPIDGSSFFFQYLAGYLEVDYIDDFPEDLIATDRKSLNWGSPLLSDLKDWLASMVLGLEQEWRVKRRDASKEKISNTPIIEKLKGTIKTEQGQIDFDHSIEVLSDAEIDTEEAVDVVSGITVEFPDFHNKNLTQELANLTFNSYQEGKYYDAVFAGVKRFISKTRNRIDNQDGDEMAVITAAFHENNGMLNVCAAYDGYKNLDTGAEIAAGTKRAIQRGSKLLSEAMWAAFRNPIAHEETEDLHKSNIYTAEDCLDALSLLSHLFRRLDKAEIRNP
jgi:uncharacterized protein (TIGR02391 family)